MWISNWLLVPCVDFKLASGSLCGFQTGFWFPVGILHWLLIPCVDFKLVLGPLCGFQTGFWFSVFVSTRLLVSCSDSKLLSNLVQSDFRLAFGSLF